MTILQVNGAGLSTLSESQQSCVDLLQEALTEALAGRVDAVCIGVCLQGGYASVMAGHKAAELNLCLDSLKRKILGAVEDDGNRKQTRSSILRAQ